MRAVDQAGNIDQSPASHTWNVADTIAPETTITGGQPTNPTTSTSASFQFSGTDNFSAAAALTFQCRLDSTQAGDWATCTSPKPNHGLGGGSHTFEVRATDQAGNVDATPASYTWTVTIADTTAPDTNIDQKPPLTTTDTNASFTFSSPESGVTYECKLDTGAWEPSCVAPKSYSGLGVGPHTFQVRATDAANNQDPSAASYSWTIQSPAPPANCGPQTVLTANADTWIDQGSPSVNKGGDSNLKVMSKGGSNLRSLVRFLMPPMPAGCKVEAATLRLYAGGYKDGRTLEAWRLDDAWSETTVTWGDAPATAGTPVTAASGAGYRDWNVTSHVQTMYDSSEHNGFLIRDATDNEDAEQQFHSREKSSDQPQLVLLLAPSGPPGPPPVADTTAPETSIDQGPPDQTSDTAGSFHFSSNETGSTFQCRLNSQQESAFAACTSPRIYSGLQPGSNIFEVRAKDAAGNVDQTPARWTWVITVAPADTTPPETTVNGPASSQSTSATFTFSSSETGSTFACSRDNAPYTSCLSPLTLTGFAVGPHTFSVKATDTAGNQDQSAATHSWTVQAPPPPNCGTQQTVGANADAWLDQGSPSSNKGSDSVLKVMAKGSSSLRALVRFNLPTIPAGCVVDFATLRLYAGGYKYGPHDAGAASEQQLERGLRELVEPAYDDGHRGDDGLRQHVGLARVERRGPRPGHVLEHEQRLPHPRRERERRRGAAVQQPREGIRHPAAGRQVQACAVADIRRELGERLDRSSPRVREPLSELAAYGCAQGRNLPSGRFRPRESRPLYGVPR